MPSEWFSVVVDCEEPRALAAFWCSVLNFQVVHDSADFVGIAAGPSSFPGVEFVRAEHHQRRKSPIHIDLNPDDQAEEVERLLALGARRIDVGQPEDASWVVLADPEGNAFCVLSRQDGWNVSPT